MRRFVVVVVALLVLVGCDPPPVVSSGSGGSMAEAGVLSQTPGRGWRWSVVDGSTLVEQGAAYFSSSAEAEDDAERLLGSAWPGTPSEDFATVDDAEEDGWHYVGEAGEPAFDMSVSPAVGYSLPAFRLREAGIVDIVAGVVLSEDGGTLFTLPADYRPSAAFVFPLAKYTTGGGLAPSYGSVNTSGNVAVENGEAFNTDVFWINLSFFLLPPTAAS